MSDHTKRRTRCSFAPLAASAAVISVVGTGCAGTAAPGSKSPSPAVDRSSPLEGPSFTSTRGRQAGEAVGWLHTTPLRLTFARQDGVLTAILVTPCNTVNVPVVVRGDRLVPDTADRASGAMACRGEAGEQEHWATEFVSSEMTFIRTGSSLVLETNDAEIDFAS